MVKASDAIGRHVTARRGGREVGKVEDLIVDPSGREVMGIVLSEHRLKDPRVVPWSAVQAFGPDSVVINGPGSVVKVSEEPDIKAVLDQKTYIKGLKLLTTRGKELGKINDFSFDETTGAITGYELRSRLFSDSIEGNPFLPAPEWIGLGKDVAVVAPESVATIQASTEVVRQPQPGGRQSERWRGWRDPLQQLLSRGRQWSFPSPKRRQ
jgi:uncharacterized protein YrrD